MSDNKIWFSKNITKETVLKALNTLLALHFTGEIIGLKFVNFFKICKDLGVEIKNKDCRDQAVAKNACADKLVAGKVGFTTPITETFSDFRVKIFDNGSIAITGTHQAYSGGFFEWSPFHCFIEVKTDNGVAFMKIGQSFVKQNKVFWKASVPSGKQKLMQGLPGFDKNAKRYLKIESNGFIFWIDTSWSKGKVFLDKKAYQTLIKKANSTSVKPTATPITAEPTGLTAEENDE